MSVISRFRNAVWNAFTPVERPVTSGFYASGPPTYGGPSPSRTRRRYYNDKSIISSIYTRIAIDVAAVTLRHVKFDEYGRYSETMDSHLNTCLTLEPNLDQGPRAFRQDIALSLFDQGVAVIVPVDTTVNPNTQEVFDILSMRVGEVKAWFPQEVQVNVYNEANGEREEVRIKKRSCAIVENPLHNVMNETNSTLQRLIRKLNLLDSVDEATSSGKLDLIIQLPYVVKTEAKKQQAEQRRQDIEWQLKGSQYGIAYTDGTEKITQLNRPVENNLLKQIEYLTDQLFGELGITKSILDGTADEQTMLNYFNRTIEPIVDAIVEAMQRSFLGRAGTRRDERIHYFRDPFKLVPLSQIAEIADKFTRNEVLSSNEIRGFMGIHPSMDPKADELRNSNMPQPDAGVVPDPVPAGPSLEEVDALVKETFDGFSAEIDRFMKTAAGG